MKTLKSQPAYKKLSFAVGCLLQLSNVSATAPAIDSLVANKAVNVPTAIQDERWELEWKPAFWKLHCIKKAVAAPEFPPSKTRTSGIKYRPVQHPVHQALTAKLNEYVTDQVTKMICYSMSREALEKEWSSRDEIPELRARTNEEDEDFEARVDAWFKLCWPKVLNQMEGKSGSIVDEMHAAACAPMYTLWSSEAIPTALPVGALDKHPRSEVEAEVDVNEAPEALLWIALCYTYIYDRMKATPSKPTYRDGMEATALKLCRHLQSDPEPKLGEVQPFIYGGLGPIWHQNAPRTIQLLRLPEQKHDHDALYQYLKVNYEKLEQHGKIDFHTRVCVALAEEDRINAGMPEDMRKPIKSPSPTDTIRQFCATIAPHKDTEAFNKFPIRPSKTQKREPHGVAALAGAAAVSAGGTGSFRQDRVRSAASRGSAPSSFMVVMVAILVCLMVGGVLGNEAPAHDKFTLSEETGGPTEEDIEDIFDQNIWDAVKQQPVFNLAARGAMLR